MARNKAVCLVRSPREGSARGYKMTISDTSYRNLEHVLQKYQAKSLVLLLCLWHSDKPFFKGA